MFLVYVGVVWVLVSFPIFGVLLSFHAVLTSRTPQGSIAWGVALITMPVVSIPLYLVLGRSRFNGLVNARRAGIDQID